MKAGFIGLGHLERAMAGRLASQGVDLIFWNRIPEKTAALSQELGLLVAESTALLREKSAKSFVCRSASPRCFTACPPAYN